MQIKISKKLSFIFLGIFLLALAGVSAWLQWGDLEGISSLFKNKKVEPVAKLAKKEAEIEEIETTGWEDPAGFAFSYNKILKIDDHPEDQVNYANLELTAPAKKGSIKIIVNDTEYKDVDGWFKNDKSVKKGSAIDTKVAELKAKKVVLSEPQAKIITAFIDADQVIYLLELHPGDEDRFWQRNYEVILSSFKLIPLQGEEIDSLRLLQTEGLGQQTGGQVIVEEEEVIE